MTLLMDNDLKITTSSTKITLSIKERVDLLIQSIKESNEALHQVRDECKHPNYSIGLWSWRVGSIEPARICNDCQINIGGITEAEIGSFERVVE